MVSGKGVGDGDGWTFSASAFLDASSETSS